MPLISQTTISTKSINMSKFHLLAILPLLHLQHLLVAVGFELAAVPNSHHDDQQLPRCHEDDGAALLEFKSSFAINQDYCDLEQWKIGSNCCTWDGIECDVRDGRIIGLDLSGYGYSCLSGSINSTSSLFRLLHLQKLNLAFIDFNQSPIPSAIGHFSRLTSLNLTSCWLAGPIPSQLLRLTNLTNLDLSWNQDLVLSQNPSFENLTRSLTKLEQLHLHGISISSLLPDHAVTNLTSLKVLDISECGLTGELPSSIFNLPKLQLLDVSYNMDLSVHHLPEFQPGSPLQRLLLNGVSIFGGLPNSLGNLASLTELSVDSTHSTVKLGGFIPSSISNLTKLTSLSLPSCEINGPLPSSFGYLTQLSHLDLSQNNLTGHVPSSFGYLTQLSYLDLSQNQLTGHIPSSFGYLTQLSNLDLSQNQLTGHIPSSFRDLINLTNLNLHSNQLTGEVPSQISKLTNLTFLDLSDNKLQGIVQLDMFLGLKLLNSLSLSSNNLSVVINTKSNATANHSIQLTTLGLRSCKLREFPEPVLVNQQTLGSWDLSDNELHGVIPSWFFNVGFNLNYLNLSRNFLTSFPQNSVLYEWPPFLQTLDLSFNKLHGSIPLPHTSINIYDVSNNYLSGEIAPLICIPSSLTHLDLSNNNFTGVIPQCIVNLTYSLEVLSLKGNNFVGKIPEMGVGMSDCSLMMIDLSNNQLVGQLPRSLSNCTMLEYLNFGNNMLSDTFPSWLGSLGGLTVLILRSNKLHGVIQDVEEGLEFPQLQIIDLSQNYLEGHLPSKLFKSWNFTRAPHGYFGTFQYPNPLSNFYVPMYFYYYTMTLTNKGKKLEYQRIFAFLKAIDLSSNDFSGSVPTSFADIRGLQLLNLSNNHLIGPIPPFLGGLRDLQALDLSRNSFSGGIPQQLVQLYFLAFFNVSDNNLSGSIPRGYQFNTFGDASYQGNEGLCGAPLSRDCGNNLEPPAAEDQDEQVSSFYIEWKAVVVGYASAFIVAALIGHHKITVRQNWFVIISRLREQGRGRRRRQR